MAIHKGSEGVLKVGANTIAEVRSWSIDESAGTIETTVMADAARTYVASKTDFTASMEVFWDEEDTTGQGALTAGAEVTFNVYPEGDTSGDTYYTGSAIVTGISRSADGDSMVTHSISLQGSGGLTETTVA